MRCGYKLLLLVLILILTSAVTAEECNKVFFCTEFSDCKNNIRTRSCDIAESCVETYNVNIGFDNLENITPINEELLCANYNINRVERNQVIYFDDFTSSARTNIVTGTNLSIYSDNSYNIINVLEVGSNYTIAKIDNINFIFYDGSNEIFDLNYDNIDDVNISFISQGSNKKILHLSLIKKPEVAKVISSKVNNTQILANEIMKIEGENLDRQNRTWFANFLIIILIAATVIVFYLMFLLREREFEKIYFKLKRDSPSTNFMGAVREKKIEDEAHKIKIRKIKRKDYYNKLDSFLAFFKKEIESVKKLNKKVDRIKTKNLKREQAKIINEAPVKKAKKLSKSVKKISVPAEKEKDNLAKLRKRINTADKEIDKVNKKSK